MQKATIGFFTSNRLKLCAVLFVLLFLIANSSTAFAMPQQIPAPPPFTPYTELERSATSCTFRYAGSSAETCAGYSAYPCTCTIICPTCLQDDDTCTGISTTVVNMICGNTGWKEADRYPEWRYYTVTKYRRPHYPPTT